VNYTKRSCYTSAYEVTTLPRYTNIYIYIYIYIYIFI